MQFFGYVYYRKWDYPSILKADVQPINVWYFSKIPFKSTKWLANFKVHIFLRICIDFTNFKVSLRLACLFKVLKMEQNSVILSLIFAIFPSSSSMRQIIMYLNPSIGQSFLKEPPWKLMVFKNGVMHMQATGYDGVLMVH